MLQRLIMTQKDDETTTEPCSVSKDYCIGQATLHVGPRNPPDDPVNHPDHYTFGGIECIEALGASMSPEAFKGYLKGSCMAYVWRYEHKGGLTDIEKAVWYLEKLVSVLKAEDNDED